MGGDKLSVLLFFVGTGIAAMMAAMQVSGWRSRLFWGATLVCGIGAIVYIRTTATGQTIVGLRTVWSLSPLIAIAMYLILYGGRTEKKLPPKPIFEKPAAINPALTADHFNAIVASGTRLEAKRRLAEYEHQRAQIVAEVVDVHEAYNGIRVKVAGLVSTPTSYLRYRTMTFRRSQADALAVIKPGDWIEFTGKVQHDAVDGWELVDCDFVGRAQAPAKPRARGNRPASGRSVG
ncbi:MAG: hypothetical protein JHD15_09300 [Phenylobacterium sp.]|uniref:hypothetical protein n=1 Tax=Phenylobacterium sp. TaxID=1871053 RepID=UPI001A2DFD79|nr:hypothetical protein [Phenylobacterium sp.]MBJ7410545.1 hypothetical protein [Phenylobacterium sp.]